MKQIVIIFLIVLLSAQNINSQINNELTDLASFLKQKEYVAIPINKILSGHLCLIAEINGIFATLILDTGAGVTILESKRAEKFQLDFSISENSATGAGGSNLTLSTSTIKELKIADFFVENYEVYLMNLDHVNNAFLQMGLEEVDGVIGADILTNNNAIIDYGNLILYLKK